jgi:hypothetical protein
MRNTNTSTATSENVWETISGVKTNRSTTQQPEIKRTNVESLSPTKKKTIPNPDEDMDNAVDQDEEPVAEEIPMLELGGTEKGKEKEVVEDDIIMGVGKVCLSQTCQ